MRRAVFIAAISAALLGVWSMVTKQSDFKKIERLRVRFSIGRTMPDPAKIVWTGDWYVLDHLSSGLIHFDSTRGSFREMLAEKWEIFPDNTHRFYLKKDIVFSDGTPIKARDFAATLKRLLIKKSSSHFPLWEYVEGCEGLKSMKDDCSGLKIVNEHTLDIKLNGRYSTFLLQLASPETGVWSADDILDDKNLTIQAKRFSGPYVLESFDPKTNFVLKRNSKNFISQQFPDSPERIEIPLADMEICEEMMARGELDVFVRNPKPIGEKDWSKYGVETLKSSPSTLVYFGGVSADTQKQKVAFEVLEHIWKNNPFKELSPATSLLPFEKAYKLEVKSISSDLSVITSPVIRLGVPYTYFPQAFLDFLKDSFRSFGSELQIVVLSRDEYPLMLDNPRAIEKIDYLLIPYAASERYPAVQLRFMTGLLKHSPVDLKEAETPELDDKQVSVLKAYQKWLLQSGHVVPLFFEKTLILHQNNIDLGIQEAPDSEVEFWRLRKKN